MALTLCFFFAHALLNFCNTKWVLAREMEEEDDDWSVKAILGHYYDPKKKNHFFLVEYENYDGVFWEYESVLRGTDECKPLAPDSMIDRYMNRIAELRTEGGLSVWFHPNVNHNRSWRPPSDNAKPWLTDDAPGGIVQEKSASQAVGENNSWANLAVEPEPVPEALIVGHNEAVSEEDRDAMKIDDDNVELSVADAMLQDAMGYLSNAALNYAVGSLPTALCGNPLSKMAWILLLLSFVDATSARGSFKYLFAASLRLAETLV